MTNEQYKVRQLGCTTKTTQNLVGRGLWPLNRRNFARGWRQNWKLITQGDSQTIPNRCTMIPVLIFKPIQSRGLMVLSLNERSFKQEVLEAPTPVLVNFWAPWCGICLLINPVLKGFEAEWGETVKIVGINADQTLKLASTYRIATLPTLILFDGGSIIHRIEGFQGRDDLTRELRSLLLSTQTAHSYSQLQPAINS